MHEVRFYAAFLRASFNRTLPKNNNMKRIFTGATGPKVLSPLIPCVLLCLLAGCKTGQPGAAALKNLQGHWEGGGAGGIKCSITISGNSLHFYSRPDFWYETS